MCSSSLAQSRADSFEAKFDGWFVREPDTNERLIFDSLILNFVVTKRGHPLTPQGRSKGEIESEIRREISQRKLNCALYVEFL